MLKYVKNFNGTVTVPFRMTTIPFPNLSFFVYIPECFTYDV